jgi:hypothetical protein
MAPHVCSSQPKTVSTSKNLELAKMKYAFLALSVLVSATALVPSEASAVVCAAGVVHAGCVGPHGAVGVRRPVVRPVAHPVVAPVRCTFVNGVRVCR